MPSSYGSEADWERSFNEHQCSLLVEFSQYPEQLGLEVIQVILMYAGYSPEQRTDRMSHCGCFVCKPRLWNGLRQAISRRNRYEERYRRRRCSVPGVRWAQWERPQWA